MRIRLLEVLFLLAGGCLVVMLLFPWVSQAREASRARHCLASMNSLFMALDEHHSAKGHLPDAAEFRLQAGDVIPKDVNAYTQKMYAGWNQP